MIVQIWTTASDTDAGTHAFTFPNETESEQWLWEQAEGEMTVEELKTEYDGDVWEALQQETSDFDTYNQDYHTLEIPLLKIVADTLKYHLERLRRSIRSLRNRLA